MLFFTIQTLLLLAIAYILGCVLGCWLHRLFGAANEPAGVAPVAVAAVAAAPTAVAAYRAPEPERPAAPAPIAAAQVAADPEPVGFSSSAPAIAASLMGSPPKAKAAAKPKAVAQPAPKPKAASAPAKAAVPAKAPAKPDDLKRIRGIGRQNEARLNALSVFTFAQIAGWSKKDQEEYGERLAFPGRIEREEWVSQAKVLAKGGDTEFSKRVARGEVATSVGKGTVGDVGIEPKGLLKAARKGKPDNLTLIDGVGNAIEKRLHEIGLYHFDQIAKLSDAEADWVGIAVGFPGRVQRENWRADAAVLAAGGVTDHAKRVEAGEIETSRTSTKAENGKK
jgi:predicted flap endonuclease-1-like 5' DNA nuclease